MNKAGERLYNGLVKENPTFVLMLGMCPTLAVTTSAMNGLGMGLTTMVVLALSNLIISLLRKIIPNRVRIPAFIVIIASFVTAVQLLLEAYIPSLNKSLGVYIPLIVVNCIILGRAESYAYSNPPVPSLFDGIGMGLGFTFALTCIGAVRELIGAGELFGFGLMPDSFEPVRIFGQAPGAFFVLAALVALQNYIKNSRKKKGKSYEKIGSGCTEDCTNCGNMNCKRRFYDVDAVDEKKGSESAPKERKSGKENPVRENVQEVKKSSKENQTYANTQEMRKRGQGNPAREGVQEVSKGSKVNPAHEDVQGVKKSSKENPVRENVQGVKKSSKGNQLRESAQEMRKSGQENQVRENAQEGKKGNKEKPAHENTQEVKKSSKETGARESAQEVRKSGQKNQVRENAQEGKKSSKENGARENAQEMKKGGKENPVRENVQEEISEELAFEALQEESIDEGLAFEGLQEENMDEDLAYESLQEEDSDESMIYESLQYVKESRANDKLQTAKKEER